MRFPRDVAIETHAFIGGEYCDTQGGLIEKTSPIDGSQIPTLHAASLEDVGRAVEVAQQAYQSRAWRALPQKEKKQILLKWADLIEKNIASIALLDTIETGRPYQNFVNDSLPKAIAALRWFAEACDKLQDQLISNDPKKICLIKRESLGVVGIITPWNDPMVTALWKISPALAMGNSVVVKPAEQASYSILKIASLGLMAGIPSGVLNVVPGYGEIAGNALVQNNLVKGIFFTGSSEVGRSIMTAVGQSSIKKIGLECGGKSAYVVTENCSNLELSAKTLAKNIFYNQGQICSAPSRLIISEKIVSKFISFLSEEMKQFIPSNPLEEGSIVGAVSSKAQYEKIMAYIKIGEDEGYKKISHDDFLPPFSNGYYVLPTVFLNVPLDSPLFQEEIFGPVLTVSTFTKIHDAIEMANSTKYGLAASVWSDLLDEALTISQSLEAGIVHINSYGEDDISIPFGGINQSGLGVDKSLKAFEEYSVNKSLVINIINSSI
jgi:acyl-CoA reductase-like NAD-dependent aldehyde dehydrogenase